MGLFCKFIMPNDEYSQDFADEHHQGKESEDNFKILWEDEIEISNEFKEIKELKNAIYLIKGQKDGASFEYGIPNVRIWEIIGEVSNQIVVSESILDTFSLKDKRLEVTFKELSVFANVIPGTYIEISDFPKELH